MEYDYRMISPGVFVVTFDGIDTLHVVKGETEVTRLVKLLNDPEQKDWGFTGFDDIPEHKE